MTASLSAPSAVLHAAPLAAPVRTAARAVNATKVYGSGGTRVVALDDVTLSGANLALLTRCHFDLIKIDRSLVAELSEAAPRPSWVDGLAALLRTTSLQVIGEGVETAFQEDVLRQAGVQMAQGQYVSPALSAAGLRRFHAASQGPES